MSVTFSVSDLCLLEADYKGDENLVDKILKRSQELNRLLNVKYPVNDSSNPELACRKWICIEIALREQDILYSRNRLLNILTRVSSSQYRRILITSRRQLKLPPPTVEFVKKRISMKYTHQYLDAAVALIDKWRNSESSNSFKTLVNSTTELCASFQTIATNHKLKLEKGSLIDMGELHPETFDAVVKSFQDMESNGFKSLAGEETKVSELRTPDSAEDSKLLIKPANVRSYFGTKAAAKPTSQPGRTVTPASSSSLGISKSSFVAATAASSSSASVMNATSSIRTNCLSSAAATDSSTDKYQQDDLSTIGDCQILPSVLNRKRKTDLEVSSSSYSVMGRGRTLTKSSFSISAATAELVSSTSSASMLAKSITATTATATASSESDAADLLRERFRYAAYRKWKQEVVAKRSALGINSSSSGGGSSNNNMVVGDS